MAKKRKFLVSLAKPDPRIKGMDIYGKVRKFSKNGHSFTLSDPGEAAEINKEFGRKRSGDIVVSEIPGNHDEKGHRYTFGPRTRGKRCAEKDCPRFAFMGDYCPKHRKLAQTDK